MELLAQVLVMRHRPELTHFQDVQRTARLMYLIFGWHGYSWQHFALEFSCYGKIEQKERYIVEPAKAQEQVYSNSRRLVVKDGNAMLSACS